MNNTPTGYAFKLTSIGSNSWQLFVSKIVESSDYIRVVYGMTEQVGGGPRTFKKMRDYILTPQINDDPVFIFQFNEYMMKNRRVWVMFETVKRNPGKKGTGTGTYMALSPVQSKWRNGIGLTTPFEVKPLDAVQFQRLWQSDVALGQGSAALLEE
jgi:hypothetical protein